MAVFSIVLLKARHLSVVLCIICFCTLTCDPHWPDSFPRSAKLLLNVILKKLILLLALSAR